MTRTGLQDPATVDQVSRSTANVSMEDNAERLVLFTKLHEDVVIKSILASPSGTGRQECKNTSEMSVR